MATLALTTGRPFRSQISCYNHKPIALKMYFDGGKRDQASYGWVLLASYTMEFTPSWVKIASAAAPLGDTTTVDAELRGASEAVLATINIVEQAQWS